MRATARILAVRETGKVVAGRREVELDLEVSAGEAQPYPVTRRLAVARVAVAGFTPGATLPVTVDPTDPTGVAIG